MKAIAYHWYWETLASLEDAEFWEAHWWQYKERYRTKPPSGAFWTHVT